MVSEQTRLLQNDLRQELAPWTFAPYIIAGLALTMLDPHSDQPASWTTIGVFLLLPAMVLVLIRHGRHPVVATLGHALLASVILLAWRWFPDSDIQYALLIPLVSVAMLQGFWAPLALGALCTVPLAIGTVVGMPGLSWGYASLLKSLTLLWTIALLAGLAQRPQSTMLEWAWQGYGQARHHLEEARDRQVELKQALEDLALANSQTIRLNELLTAAREAVEEARRAKEEFVANVSHELRTPLNMIIGFSDMILESPEVYARRLPPALLADVSAIKRNSQHLANLVDDVLDLSEADTGHMQIFKEWTSIPEVVLEATEAVSALFQKKGLSLSTQIADDVVAVSCDRTRIRQVILNLLSNAGRFTERGGAEIRAYMQDTDTVIISVSDTGPGMDATRLARMFEPFQQADDSIRRRYGGSGLGLAISKRFVEMHGGKIWLESEVGAGTTAFFTLPVRQELPEATARRWFGAYQEYAPRTRRSLAPAVDARPRVVVVEQGHALCQLISHYLQALDPVCVPNLEEAAREIEAQAAIALCINQPPAASRNGVGKVPLPLAFDVPILSCWVPERREAFSHMGAQDYLIKPINRTDLLNSVARIAPEARTILLVDDDPEARQLFGRTLASAGRGYLVTHAGDGAVALALLKERRPDVMLLDLMMPRMDGFTVLEAMSEDADLAGIPVIIISAADPQREPIVSQGLAVTRQDGLSARDLMLALEALTQTLQPRFGAQAQPET